MAKPRRPRIPSIASMTPNPAVKTRPYDAAVLGLGKAHDYGSSQTAKARADSTLDPATEHAIQAAKNGDDSLLLPYQPTPSINPPRPRTLAAGYDAKTKTLRVRFRDGVGYEYYDVPPSVWRNFKRVRSPGRAINRVLNNYSYAPADW